MKKISGIIISLLILEALFNLAYTQNVSQESYTIQPGSKIWFEGSSTINKFTCGTKHVYGYGYYESSVPIYAKYSTDTSYKSHETTKVYVSIEVPSFDCGDERINKDMYKALNEKSHPVIWYQLREFKIITYPGMIGEWFQINTWGALFVAGKMNEINMPVKIRQLLNNQFQIIGSKPLSMHEYGITPPTALWGLIKAKDHLVIHFDLIVSTDNNESTKQTNQFMTDSK